MKLPFNSTVYIAGKMRGVDLYNFKNFFYWQVMFEKSGYVVINPAAIDCEKALYTDWFFTEEKYDEILEMDCEIIREKADALFVLSGWETSVGAKREIEVAKDKGIPVYYEEDKQ